MHCTVCRIQDKMYLQYNTLYNIKSKNYLLGFTSTVRSACNAINCFSAPSANYVILWLVRVSILFDNFLYKKFHGWCQLSQEKTFSNPQLQYRKARADSQAKRINRKKFQLEGSETLGLLFAMKSILNLTRFVAYHYTKFNQRWHLSAYIENRYSIDNRQTVWTLKIKYRP